MNLFFPKDKNVIYFFRKLNGSFLLMEYIKNSINDDIVPALPNNIEAEQYILGALLINNNHLEKIIDFLS